MSKTIEDRTGLEVIFRDECMPLLEDRAVGRLGFTLGGQPIILPVNYVVDGEAIVFRTADGTKFDALQNSRVAFEVDGIDSERRTGWSVLVQGRAYEITDRAERERVAGRGLQPWSTTDKPHWMRIVPTSVTGRRIANAHELSLCDVSTDWSLVD